jgi:ribosomal protein L13
MKVWHEVDAKDKVLGKLAARIAIALRGKYKPNYNSAGRKFILLKRIWVIMLS